MPLDTGDGSDLLYDDTIALFYKAALQPALRYRGLSALAAALKASGAAYLAFDLADETPLTCEIAGTVSPESTAYRAAMGLVDPQRKLLAAAPSETVFIADEDGAEPTDLSEAGIAGHRVGRCLAAQLVEIDGVCRQVFVERAAGGPPFTFADIRSFRNIVRHMATAERMAAAWAARSAESELPRRVLDALPLGALVADESRKLRYANAAAETILAASDGIVQRDDRLHAARAFETGALASALRGPGNSMELADGAVLVARPSGKRPYALLVTTLPAGSKAREDEGERLSLVLMADLEMQPQGVEPRLMRLFGLTKSEAAIAAAIARGRRLGEIAAERARGMPTVRSQLRAAMRKLSVGRQAELVRIIDALPTVFFAAADAAPEKAVSSSQPHPVTANGS